MDWIGMMWLIMFLSLVLILFFVGFKFTILKSLQYFNAFFLFVSGILRYKVDFQSMQLEDGLDDDLDIDYDDY